MTPFQPGNRSKGGRPPLTEEIKDFRRLLDKMCIERAPMIIAALIAKAERGDVNAIREVLDRWQGKVPDKMIHAGATVHLEIARMSDDELLAEARKLIALKDTQSNGG